MSNAKGFAPKTSELATAKDTAITVQATSPAPIAADISNQWEVFTDRPAVAATASALIATGKGFKTVWDEEKENEYGKSFILWGFGVLKSIFLPLFSLLWLALNGAYIWSRKPETKTAVKAKWQALKTWASPKFGYEKEGDRQAELNL